MIILKSLVLFLTGQSSSRAKGPILKVRLSGAFLAFLDLESGSGMGKKPKSGSEMNIPDFIFEKY
jgi:hypothetical protein